MQKKITVISLDHWKYDKHIIAELQKNNVAARHINFIDYKHKSFTEKIENTFLKIFLNKNLKKQKRQQYIIDELEKTGSQDQILVINPDLIDKEFHLKIKKFTNHYIAYLYDSVARHPVEHLLNGIFDTIFSFDDNDVKKFGFQKITNYNYLPKKELKFVENPGFEVFNITSYDNRINFLEKLSLKLNKLKISHNFIIVRKKNVYEKINPFYKPKNDFANIKYQSKRINQDQIATYFDKTNTIVDIVRDNQVGLSFRVFEAMAYQKKLITSNPTIVNYDFYNPNNILVVNEEMSFDNSFFDQKYEPIEDKIYYIYTIQNWVKTVFEI